MEIKELLNEYYTDETISQPPFSPQAELSEIKRRYAAAKRKKRRIIYAAATSAAAVMVAIGAFAAFSSFRPMKPEPPVNIGSAVTATPERPAQQAALATKRPIPKRESVPKEMPESLPDCTYPPEITMPPLRTADLSESTARLIIPDTELPAVQEPSFAPVMTREPEKEKIRQERIRIEEKEDVPSGASAYAGEGDGGEADGEIWSEERYFSYLGIDPLAALRLPSDLKRSVPEEVFMMTDESGTPFNDRRTFTFSNSDRTRLATVTTSKSTLSDTPITGEINGIKAAIYDNHMTAAAFLEGRICVMIETYGLSEDEISEAVRSCAEVLR